MATPSNYQIEHLCERPVHIDRVAAWIYAEFWADKQIHTPASLACLLRDAACPDAIPLSLLALVGGEPVGTVNLIECDDDKRGHLRPWLAALFVVPEYRGRGIGSRLVCELAGSAATLGYTSVYLGTDSPGFYARLGAKVHEQVTNEFAIMQLRCPIE
jgi:predicted N-acetyltransferase YhbS